eukprot:gene18662-22281_t
MSQYIRTALETHLPLDAHERATGRLLISNTYLSCGVIPRFQLTQTFKSRAELIEILLGSCYIPFYYESPVLTQGRLWLDGGLKDNLPCIDHTTLTISPFFEHADISPNANYRLADALFPR